ncbi:hypothetical protein [Photobacterium chitinilyticum]|nr:hypothetical protein [Photobacterium chitinilyticum]
MTQYKKKKLFAMAMNASVMVVCFVLLELDLLGLVPMIVMACCAVAIFGNAMLYFFNYDEEGVDLSDLGKTVAKSGVDGLAELRKK